MAPESLLVMFIALAAGSLVKGISGLGLPLVAIPVMAGFMEVDRAVAIMIIPGFLMNCYLLWAYREHAVNFASLPLIIVVGVSGVVFGSWVFSNDLGEPDNRLARPILIQGSKKFLTCSIVPLVSKIRNWRID